MKSIKRQQEDRSVLALLYDEYRRMYPETVESLQWEIERLYQDLHYHHLANPEEITAVFIGICDDRSRYAYEDGVRTGVRLALDLELDGMMGGCKYVPDL